MALDDQILESTARRNLVQVYHFIGLPFISNLIAKDGLYCRKMLMQAGDDFDDDPYKWGSPAKAAVFADFISCSVNPPMGMLIPEKQPILIEMNAPIIAQPGVVFIGKWSSHADVEASALQQTGLEWFERMFLNEWTNHATPHPGEFLVPGHIPLADVRRLIFYSKDDLDEARKKVGKTRAPRGKIKVAVDPAKFGHKMKELANNE